MPPPHLCRRAPLAGLALVLAACRTAPGPLVPVAAAPVTEAQVTAWVRPTVPEEARLLRFKWLFRDDNSSAGGRGSARIAPPDSLRFDVSGPFGSNASAAAVVGDSALWVEPEDAIEKLVPSYPLMWALLGVARLPDADAELRGSDDGRRTAWEYAHGEDTIAYARTSGTPGRLFAEVRHAGKVVGRVETMLGADGRLQSSRLTVPSAPARLDLTFLSADRPDSFAREIWLPRGR
ncbi:MAG TPA: hypothetical protein VFU46_10505 [Gemmatimonadales bacterium]|nr:hypothetical protein [Gemmatimonadales bacterium]